MNGVVEHADRDGGGDVPAKGHRQGGLPDPPVRGVRDHDRVRAQQLALAFEEGPQALRAGLLLPFDEEHDLARRPAVVREERGEVRGDAGLVIRCPPAVQPAIALDRLEGIRGPALARTFGLHVVVRVEQHLPRARGAGDAADHRRMAALARRIQHAALDPGASERSGDGFGR